MNIFSLFDVVLDAVFVVNTDNLIVHCNEPAGYLVDLSMARIKGKKRLDEVLEVDDTRVFQEASKLGNLEYTAYQDIEYRVPKSNRSGILRVCIQLVIIENNPYMVVIGRDMTEHFQLQEKYVSSKSSKEAAEEEVSVVREQVVQLEKAVKDSTVTDLKNLAAPSGLTASGVTQTSSAIGLTPQEEITGLGFQAEEKFSESAENKALNLNVGSVATAHVPMAKLTNPVTVTLEGGISAIQGKSVSIGTDFIEVYVDDPFADEGRKVAIEVVQSKEFAGFNTTGIVTKTEQGGNIIRIEFERLRALAKRAIDDYLDKNAA